MLLLIGCQQAPTPLDPVLSWSPEVASVLWVDWAAPAGASYVEFGLDGVLDRRTPESDAPRAVVLGLKAGRSYTVRAVTEADGVRYTSAPEVVEVAPAPPGVPYLAFDEGEELASGFVLYGAGPVGDVPGSVVIADADGDPVWWRILPPGHSTASPSFSPHEAAVVWQDYPFTPGVLVGGDAHLTALDGSSDPVTPMPLGHHVAIETAPGTLAWLDADVRAPGPGDAASHVMTDRIVEAPSGSTDPARVVLDLYDDYFGGTFAYPCEHASTPVPALAGYQDVAEWTHSNSLAYLEDRDALLVHLRWVDTLLLVDRLSGDIEWQLGGPGGDFTLPDGAPAYVDADHSPLFSHGHFSQAWDGGLVMLDNAVHGDVSGFVELAWDEDARTVREVFRYRDPEGRKLPVLNDVRKLPNGGYLLAWTTPGELLELSETGEVRWRAHLEPAAPLARVGWRASLE